MLYHRCAARGLQAVVLLPLLCRPTGRIPLVRGVLRRKHWRPLRHRRSRLSLCVPPIVETLDLIMPTNCPRCAFPWSTASLQSPEHCPECGLSVVFARSHPLIDSLDSSWIASLRCGCKLVLGSLPILLACFGGVLAVGVGAPICRDWHAPAWIMTAFDLAGCFVAFASVCVGIAYWLGLMKLFVPDQFDEATWSRAAMRTLNVLAFPIAALSASVGTPPLGTARAWLSACGTCLLAADAVGVLVQGSRVRRRLRGESSPSLRRLTGPVMAAAVTVITITSVHNAYEVLPKVIWPVWLVATSIGCCRVQAALRS